MKKKDWLPEELEDGICRMIRVLASMEPWEIIREASDLNMLEELLAQEKPLRALLVQLEKRNRGGRPPK